MNLIKTDGRIGNLIKGMFTNRWLNDMLPNGWNNENHSAYLSLVEMYSNVNVRN